MFFPSNPGDVVLLLTLLDLVHIPTQESGNLLLEAGAHVVVSTPGTHHPPNRSE